MGLQASRSTRLRATLRRPWLGRADGGWPGLSHQRLPPPRANPRDVASGQDGVFGPWAKFRGGAKVALLDREKLNIHYVSRLPRGSCLGLGGMLGPWKGERANLPPGGYTKVLKISRMFSETL